MRTIGLVPVKAQSSRLPMKNFQELNGAPLWRHSYDLLSICCTDAVALSDTQIDASYIYRPANASDPDQSILDVLKWGYMSLERPYDAVVCLFACSVLFTPKDIRAAIQILEDRPQVQEVRGFNDKSGDENGLLIFRTGRLFNPPGISSYIASYICAGREIHTQSELDDVRDASFF